MTTPRQKPDAHANASAEPTPGSGLERREFLIRSAQTLGALAAGGASALNSKAAEPIGSSFPEWSTTQGKAMSTYGLPSTFEDAVKRTVGVPYGPIAPGTGGSRTPLQALAGTITPSGLHFERHHSGVPAIDPARHTLLVHGLVSRPLVFSIAALLRYPLVSRVHFIECAGNSSQNLAAPEPLQVTASAVHGLVSCSEWTGVPLSVLLREAGVQSAGRWLLAEGADAAALSRSVPLEKALDDALVALYQNGERLRPEQGYPVRLLLPGWEGAMSVKWLRRLKVTDGPTHTKDETSKYSDPLPDGRARQFTFEMGVKSLITQPSSGMSMPARGACEVSGIAWSGAGRIARVEVSTDGGATWRNAALTGEALTKSFARFRLPWEWHGAPALLQSRAHDEKGNVQPTRNAFMAEYSPDMRFHNNSIVTWGIDADGKVRNVYR